MSSASHAMSDRAAIFLPLCHFRSDCSATRGEDCVADHVTGNGNTLRVIGRRQAFGGSRRTTQPFPLSKQRERRKNKISAVTVVCRGVIAKL